LLTYYRAVYSKADILLLDDPLSAVDARVARQLMKECIGGLLGQKCVLLVTHHTQFLAQSSQVLCMENGVIVRRGSYSEVCGLPGSADTEVGSTAVDELFPENELSRSEPTEEGYGAASVI
jgi:ABC-type bacteriocin/lantibiotic exporter with double-glycine peptidase domain